MRTTENVAAIIAEAKLTYSYKMNQYQELKQRGVHEPGMDDFFEQLTLVSNCIEAVESQTLTLVQENLLCDRIVESGFFSLIDSNLYNEEIYDDDFTVV